MNKRRAIKKTAAAPLALAHRKSSFLKRLVLRIGRTVVGVLPGARRIRAANDPER